MKRATYIIALMAVFSTATAQRANWKEALECYQEDSLTCAAEKIDLAIQDTNEAKSSYTWHLRAFIYRDIFKKSTSQTDRELARKKSVEAFTTSLSLDKTGELKTNNIKGLEFIATRLYNDGVSHLKKFEVDQGLECLEQHNSTLRLIDVNYFIEDREKSIKRAAAMILTDRYNDDNEGNRDAFEKALECFNDVLELDSNDFNSNLNVGVMYHNKAIKLLTDTRLDLSLMEVMKLQQDHVFYMQKSLTYMTKAYQSNENHPGIIRALAGAYYSLHDDEKHEYYNQKLIKLEGPESTE